MITFANLWLLLLLIPVALLGILMACRKRPSVKISTVIPLKKSSGRKKRLTVMEAALLIALALTVIALARPLPEPKSRILILEFNISGLQAMSFIITS